jgi:beta-catenin-like protein 1
MESEIELNDAVQELHAVATQSDLYPVMVNMNGITLLVGLLNHENADISVAVISVLQELTDVDTLTESEEQATFLIDALVRLLDESTHMHLMIEFVSRLSNRSFHYWFKISNA